MASEINCAISRVINILQAQLLEERNARIAEVGELRDALQSLQNDVQIISARLTEHDSAHAADGGSKQLTYEDCVGLVQGDTCMNVEESAWDMGIVIGHDAIGAAGSLVICLALVGNIVFQSVFICTIGTSFLGELHPTLEEAERWRETIGHHIQWSSSGVHTSLVSRVCSGDASLEFSTLQRNAVSDFSAYLTQISSVGSLGGLLTWVVLAIWFFSVYGELRSAYNMATALHYLPRGKTSLVRTTEGVALESISRKRLVVALGITTVRAAMDIILLVLGGLWLSNSTQLEALILNAAALGFILDIDELIYAAVSPRIIKVLVKKMEPLRQPPVRTWKGIGGFSIASLGGVLLFVVIIFVYAAMPKEVQMERTMGRICDGLQTIITDVHHDTGVVMAARSPAFTAPASNSIHFKRDALRELIDMESVSHLKPKHSRIFPNIHALQKALAQPISDLSKQYPCVDGDLEDNTSVPSYLRGALLAITNPAARSCNDLEPYCGRRDVPLLRMLCPQTCGCNMMLNGSVYTTGCPKDSCTRLPEWWGWLQSAPCRNQSSEQLRLNPTWMMLWQEMVQVGEIYAHERDIAVSSGCEIMTIPKYEPLCHDASPFKSLSPFCPIQCLCSGAFPHNWLSCPWACQRNTQF